MLPLLARRLGGHSHALLPGILQKVRQATGNHDKQNNVRTGICPAPCRAVAMGEVSEGVQPWQPWWLLEEAAELELSEAGTSLVAALGEEEGGAGALPARVTPHPPPTPAQQ